MAKNSRVYCVSIDEKGETFLYSSREFNVETIDISVLKKQGLPIPYPRNESGVSNSIGSDQLEEKFPDVRVLRKAIVKALSCAERSELKGLINSILMGDLSKHRQNVCRRIDDKNDWAEELVELFESTPRTLYELMEKIKKSDQSMYDCIVRKYKEDTRKFEFE